MATKACLALPFVVLPPRTLLVRSMPLICGAPGFRRARSPPKHVVHVALLPTCQLPSVSLWN